MCRCQQSFWATQMLKMVKFAEVWTAKLWQLFHSINQIFSVLRTFSDGFCSRKSGRLVYSAQCRNWPHFKKKLFKVLLKINFFNFSKKSKFFIFLIICKYQNHFLINNSHRFYNQNFLLSKNFCQMQIQNFQLSNLFFLHYLY